MPDAPHTKLLARKISDSCRLRVDPILPPQETTRITSFLLGLIARSQTPLRKLRGYDWEEIALRCDLDNEALRIARSAIEPALDAIARNTKGSPKPPSLPVSQSSEQTSTKNSNGTLDRAERRAAANRQKPRAKPRMIEEFPTPLFDGWIDPTTFQEALALHMRRHGDSYWHLHRAVVRDDENLDRTTIHHWLQGSKAPRSVASMKVLARIERRYRLPAGYFKAKLPHQTRSSSGHILDDIGSAERRRLAWHLPDDFNARPRREQEEILEWVRRVNISGLTNYKRFQAAAMKQPYAIRFPGVAYGRSEPANDAYRNGHLEHRSDGASFTDPDLTSGVIDARPALAMEMAELIRFKTATLTAFAFSATAFGVKKPHLRRSNIWA